MRINGKNYNAPLLLAAGTTLGCVLILSFVAYYLYAFGASKDAQLGFIGSILGSLVTVIAAGIALIGVAATLYNDRIIASRREDDAKEEVIRRLQVFIQKLDINWRAYDYAIEQNSAEAILASKCAPSITEGQRANDIFNEIKEISKELKYSDRIKCDEIIYISKIIFSDIERINTIPHIDIKRNILSMKSCRIQMTWLYIKCEIFHKELVKILSERNMESITNTNEHERDIKTLEMLQREVRKD